MTRALICTGVLGGGTAVVFALAFAVSILFPQGSMVPTGWNGGWERRMIAGDVMIQGVAPAPAPWVGNGGGVDVVAEEAAPDLIEPAIPAPAPVEEDS